MSTDVSPHDARALLDDLVAAIRATDTREDPALLIRLGRIATRVEAAEALAAHGDAAAAGLLAADAIRGIARDFPPRTLPALDIATEDGAYRVIATSELAA